MSGRFITLEGGEGVGKSTQLRRLAQALRVKGHKVVETRGPGGSEGAEQIRALLMNGEAGRWNAGAEALLFAAARSDHVARTIRPALERGDWVLCDRFVDSSRAYQGGADGISDADILRLHQVGSDGLLPDRTLLLTLFFRYMRPMIAAYHARVAAAFRALAEAEPERFRLIDALGNPDVVTDRLIAAVAGL